MIVAVANTKGGVGKTTLALSLAIERAIAGRDVWFVDGDSQATGQTAITLRAEAEIGPIVASSLYPHGAALRTQVQHQARRFDDVIIDAGGRDSAALRAALVLSDIVLVPFQPRSYDVWALDDMAKLIDEALAVRGAVKAVAVMNCADPGDRSADNREAALAVGRLEQFTYHPIPIRRRKAFAHAAGWGLSVRESKPVDTKALGELEALVDSIFSS